MESRLTKTLRILIPALLFVVILAIFPYTPSPAEDIKIVAFQIGAFVLFAMWLFTPAPERLFLKPMSPLIPLFAGFVAMHLVAVWGSPNVGYSLYYEFAKLAALFMVFIVAADVYRTPAQAWRLVAALCVAVSLSSVYGIMQAWEWDFFPWDDTSAMVRRVPATFGNPNLASHVVAPTLVLAVGLVTQRRWRWLALCCIPLFGYHLYLAQTRGSQLGLTVAALIVGLTVLAYRRTSHPQRAIALGLAGVVVIALFAMGIIASLNYQRTGQPYPEDVSITLRYHSYYGACRMIQERPWFGHGPGMYQVVNPEHWTSLERERFSRLNRLNSTVHSEPLEAAVNAGLPAVVLFIGIMMIGLYLGLFMGLTGKEPGRRPLGFALAAFFVTFFVDGIFNFNFYVPASGFLFFLFAGVASGIWQGLVQTAESEDGDQSSRPESDSSARWVPVLVKATVLVWAAAIPIFGIRDFVARIYHQHGVGALHHEAFPDAEDALRQAAMLAPYDWLNPYFRSIVARQLNRPDIEAMHLVHTLELNPGYLHAQFRLAEATFNLAAETPEPERKLLLEQTVAYAERAAQFNPLSPRVFDLLGRASFLHAQSLAASGAPDDEPGRAAWREAEEHLVRAIEYGSESLHPLSRFVALARMELGDWRNAQRALIRALDTEPDDMETWRLFWQLAQRADHYDALRIALDYHIQNIRSGADVLNPLRVMRASVSYYGYGDDSAAEEAFQHMAELSPAYPDMWVTYHEFAEETDRLDLFFECLEQALRGIDGEEDGIAPVIRVVSSGLQETSPLDEAVSQLVRLFQRDTAQAAAYVWAVDALARMARDADFAPDRAGPIWLELGLAYGACQRYDEAIEMFDDALPHLSGQRRLLGLMQKGAGFMRVDRVSEAVNTFQRATEEYPNNLDAHYALANALVRDGQHDEARIAFLHILASFSLSPEARQAIQQQLNTLS